MRFDPQSNIVTPDANAVAVAPPAPAPAARTVPVTLVLGVCVLLIAGLMWLMVGPGVTTSLAAGGFNLPQPIDVTATPPAEVALFDTHATDTHATERRRSAPRRDLAARAAVTRTVEPEEPAGNLLVSRSRTHYFRGRTYLKEGRIDEAVSELSEAVRLVPGDADAHYKLGLAYIGKRDRLAALQELAMLERLDPSLASLLGNLVR